MEQNAYLRNLCTTRGWCWAGIAPFPQWMLLSTRRPLGEPRPTRREPGSQLGGAAGTSNHIPTLGSAAGAWGGQDPPGAKGVRATKCLSHCSAAAARHPGQAGTLAPGSAGNVPHQNISRAFLHPCHLQEALAITQSWVRADWPFGEHWKSP